MSSKSGLFHGPPGCCPYRRLTSAYNVFRTTWIEYFSGGKMLKLYFFHSNCLQIDLGTKSCIYILEVCWQFIDFKVFLIQIATAGAPLLSEREKKVSRIDSGKGGISHRWCDVKLPCRLNRIYILTGEPKKCKLRSSDNEAHNLKCALVSTITLNLTLNFFFATPP